MCTYSFSPICICICPYCTYTLSLTTGWSWGPGGAAALPLLGCAIEQLLPPPTAVHRTPPVDRLRKPNLLVTVAPVQILLSLWDPERGFTSIGRTGSHRQEMRTIAVWGAGTVWLGKRRQMVFPEANRSGGTGARKREWVEQRCDPWGHVVYSRT